MKHNKYSTLVVFATTLLFLTTTINSGANPKNQEQMTPPIPTNLKEGYFLYTPLKGTTTYLINETGAVNHTWSSAYYPNLDSYMLDNGTILLSIKSGIGGFQKIAYNGTNLWEYHYTRDGSYASHDIVPLPNGDVVMIMQEIKSRNQAIQAGRNPATVPGSFCPDFLIQVHKTGPTSGAIVWEWHLWDHLIQDFDPTKANYGNVSAHPELININFGEDFTGDWIHMNSVDYNPAYDQILMSAHNFDEVWIIDHSTSTDQAAGHDGGQYDHGGDLLYRWGNPQAYNRGDASNKKLYFQHQVTWIKPGLPGAGDILVFCNGNNRPGGPASTVDEFTPDVNNVTGEYYLPPGGTYGPDNQSWQFHVPDYLYSSIWGGAQRMLNGNTFICLGINGTFIEVTPDKQIVWTFVNPYPSPDCSEVYRTEYIPPLQPKPKLYIIGHLTWTNVAPGATVKGSFQIQNVGDFDSWLNWTVNTSSLTWGTWTVSPRSGVNLTPKDGPLTINVTCIAPAEKKKQFQGAFKVQDLDNGSDNGTVSIVLQTPYSPPHPFPRLWQWIILLHETWQEFRHHPYFDLLFFPP